MRRLIVIAGFLAILTAGFAQEPQREPVARDDDTFWDVRRRLQAGAAAQLVLARNPFTVAAMRLQAERFVVWDQPEVEIPFSLNPDWLGEIQDGTAIRPTNAQLKQEHPQDWAFLMALNEAVLKAAKFPMEDFTRRAQEHSHVTISHLYGNPARFRGEVIPIKGTLKRLRKYETTLPARNDGVLFLYEGWIYGPTPKANPFQVIAVSVPEGLKESEELDKKVTFCGYFLKLNKYRSTKGDQVTPYLVGPTILLEAEPTPDAAARTPMSAQAILTVIGVIAAVVTLMLGVSWFYRRGDARVRNRLLEIEAQRTMAKLEDPDFFDCNTPKNQPE
ncbi:MAG: hypothetical protein HY040_02270 [Planctomycetes bacterium]|nr:hypothetical protein [Planctomycetota bacterium]